jgi:glycosyltransferase involved in cell wall biosynthesis
MKLTILSVAYPLAQVRPETSGGAEQILALLDRALTRAGHHSIVVAADGSEVAGTLIATPWPRGNFDEEVRRSAHAEHTKAIQRALGRWPVDLVHMHGHDFNFYLPPAGVPVLVTLHCPPEWYAPEALFPRRPDTYLHCVSDTQRQCLPAGVETLPEIGNGVPVDQLAAVHARKRNYAVCAGRICPEKGFHLAADASRRAGTPLAVVGEVFPYEAHERYVREVFQPALDRRRRWLGPAGFRRKRRLLASARCLLAPSLIAETSSLVAMEALACGTPVIAFRAGALAEIVEHGKTGYLVSDVAEMAEAIRRVECIDHETCRQAARERFSGDRMFVDYLERYKQVIWQLAAIPALA